jgi:hypothetical protein
MNLTNYSNSGSTTLTLTPTTSNESPSSSVGPLVLRLQPAPTVTWSEDVIDNEGLNRRSSKAC